eukprot:scaffold5695_cov66-Phaeocystis_antarctica.AAC.2
MHRACSHAYQPRACRTFRIPWHPRRAPGGSVGGAAADERLLHGRRPRLARGGDGGRSAVSYAAVSARPDAASRARAGALRIGGARRGLLVGYTTQRCSRRSWSCSHSAARRRAAGTRPTRTATS